MISAQIEGEPERLYRFHHSRIQGIAKRTPCSDDCCQEIWLKVLRANLPYEHEDENKNLIAHIGFKASKSFQKHQITTNSFGSTQEFQSPIIDVRATPLEEVERIEEVDLVRRVLGTLIAGRQIGGRQMKLTENSRFVVRTTADRIQQFLPLAGKTIDVFGKKLHLGVPSVHPLTAVTSLRARIVTIKGFFEPKAFSEAVRRQLDKLEVGPCKIEVGRQRTLRIKRIEVVGFETTLHELQGDVSVIVATHGIGGRRHMGCGFFVPARNETKND